MTIDSASQLPTDDLFSLYRCMYSVRTVELHEQALVDQGLANFHVSGAGHELTGAIALFLQDDDWLHLHYRDKALMFAAGMPLDEFFDGLLATGRSQSAGRQMSAHHSWRAKNITSLVGPVGNNALQAVGVASVLADGPGRGIAICSVGEGTTQQGEFLEAVAEAARLAVPIVFLIEDNGYAISTRTEGRTVFDLNGTRVSSLFDIPVRYFDGWEIDDSLACISAAVSQTRTTRLPRIIVGRFERLSSHTNSDDQSLYRPADDRLLFDARDPLLTMRARLGALGWSEAALRDLETTCVADVEAAVQRARADRTANAMGAASKPFSQPQLGRAEYRGETGGGSLTMREAINRVLEERLSTDADIFLIGQDIEDPKGDVFGLTKGLSTAYPKRVLNASLSESTIVGTCVGRALAGQKPVAFIQFADFLPLAANQIISELASMFWRTAGSWQCPVVIMAPIGGYKAGLGPFHAQTFESLFAHIPGLDVVVPGFAADAAGLLNSALECSRPTLFLYPKAMLNLKHRATSDETARHWVLPGRARHLGHGDDLTVVTWGNTIGVCQEAVDRLEEAGVSVDLIDLRSISPWDRRTVRNSVQKTGRLIVVHEDNVTGGFGAEIAAYVAEAIPDRVQVRRIGRNDTFVPFAFGLQLEVLPSARQVLEAAAELLDFRITWDQVEADDGAYAISSTGSGPADDFVQVLELHVAAGDAVREGQVVAVVEATKASVEVCSQVDGIVDTLACAVGDEIPVGAPILFLQQRDQPAAPALRPPHRPPPRARLERRDRKPVRSRELDDRIGLGGIGTVKGSRIVTTEQLCRRWPDRRAEDLVKSTGIRERRWIGEGQTLLGMALEASQQALAAERLDISDVDIVVAATGTPDIVTPSLASRVSAALSGDPRSGSMIAYDINAACSGYLYAIDQCFAYLARHPQSAALVVTAEILSPALNLDDTDTAVIFADAATATVLYGAARASECGMRIRRPLLGGQPEGGDRIALPLSGDGYMTMQGKKVFADAVLSLVEIIERACFAEHLTLNDLDLIVPHQANQRIIEAVGRRTGCRMLSVIEKIGNTSSCSIPLALAGFEGDAERIGLAAFGGGYTSAAAIVDRTAHRLP